MDALLQAAAPWLSPLFTLWGSPVTGVELLAVLLSLAMVVCNIRVNPMGWPLAILSSALYALLFLSARLYGEASLQLLFIAMAAWGWWLWLRGRAHDGASLGVRALDPRGRRQLLLWTLAAWPLLGLGLDHWTDSDVPYLDALPTAGSIAGTVLVARKLLENWPVWVLVNLVSIALFAVKGLWLTVLLYALFTAMALAGWRSWQALAARPAAAPHVG